MFAVDRSHFTDQSKRSTVALYSDELRMIIIEEVYKRPPLWDNTNREPATVAQRREIFEEIANELKSIDSSLSATIVEKQWKNLKDTYNKVKKKIYVDENGVTITPKWRFYHSMLFIDQDAPKDLQNERPHPTDFGGGASEQDNNKRLNSVGNKRPAPERSSLDDSSIPQKKVPSTNNNAVSSATTLINRQDDYNSGSEDEYASFWGIRMLRRSESPL